MNSSSIGSRLFALSLLTVFSPLNGRDHDSHYIQQEDLPVVIKKSGIYYIEENLNYCKSGAAITIKDAHNVKLVFKARDLKLNHPNATGILVKDSSEVTIENDSIINVGSVPSTGNGIHIVNSNIVRVEQLVILDNFYGVLVESSVGVVIDGCIFTDNGIGVKFASTKVGKNRDCKVVNTAFTNSTGMTNLFAEQIDGFVIEESSFSSTGSTATVNLAQLGGDASDANAIFSNALVKNSTFTNKSANKNIEGLYIYNGNGFVVDTVLIEIDNSGTCFEADLSGIHIGNGTSTIDSSLSSKAINGIISNTLVQGPATDGYYPDGGTDSVTIINCRATGARKHGIFLAGTTNSVVIGCTTTGNGTATKPNDLPKDCDPTVFPIGSGIDVGQTSLFNAILDNISSGNVVAGVDIDAPTPDHTDPNANNLIQNNKVFNNLYGIRDQGVNNQVWYNSAFDNSANYSNAAVSKIAVTNKPGCPTVTGENIDADRTTCFKL